MGSINTARLREKAAEMPSPSSREKGADAPCLLLPLLPQQAGNQRTAADTCQARQAKGQVEHRKHQGSPGHHVGVGSLPHEEGIRHVIDEHNELAGYRREHHPSQRRWNGKPLKHLLRRIHLCLHLFRLRFLLRK